MEPYIINQTGDQLQSILNKAIIKAELQTTEDGNQAIRFTASDGTSISMALPEWSKRIEYLLQNTYYLQEGIGCAAFDYKMSLGGVTIQSEEVTRQDGDSIILDTSANRFVLERSGKFYTKFASGGGNLQGSDVYASRRHTFLNRQDASYWYRKEDGTLAQGSSTFVIRNWLKTLQSECDSTQETAENAQNKLSEYADTFPQNPVASSESNGLMSAADKAKVGNYPEQFVLDLGILNSQADGERAAARSEVAGNRNISFIRFQVHGVNELKTTLIMQWPNGINETAQIMCVDKQQWRRNVTGATGVVGAPTNAYNWSRTAPHSIDYDEQRRMIQLKDYENREVSQSVELPLATSSQDGLMSSADKIKLDRLVIDTTWDEQQHMNAFTETGEYHIHGIRTRDNDGLPIINSGGGHTIDARLTVLDSSLTNGTGAKTDICVTQILRLSNRMGGDGHVYVRTAQAATKSQLATPSSTAWGTWEKLMGMFEKNAVTNIADLDTYTTNGMYSGLFADTTLQSLGGLQFTPGDTFLLITVNGYAASAFGTPQLTQMLYRLPSKKGSGNNSARMYMRTAYWDKDADPKAWVWANWDRLATASEISGGGSIHKLLVSITWSELKALRDNSQLVAGTWYRITDYTCTTTQENTRSANHPFDVIVRADSENKLNEEAFAIQHEGDDYFASSNLSAWKLWYSLDNNTTRFAWADSTNGKGVIYRMIDEWNNDIPYDFKNIQFARDWSAIAPDSGLSGTVYCYTFSIFLDGFIEDAIANDESVKAKECIESFGEGSFGNNTIRTYQQDMGLRLLNDIIFVTDYSSDSVGHFSNSFGTDCYSNSFGIRCNNNSFGNGCYSNSFGDYNSFNSFGNNCNNNSFGGGCNSNSFGTDCYSNSFGTDCYSNYFEQSCGRNSFGNNCTNNFFGGSCNSNSFGTDCNNNYFRYDCYNNSFGNSCNNNSFGSRCQSIKFASDKSASTKYHYYKNNNFGDGCNYIVLKGAGDASDSKLLQNYNFAQGVQGTSSNYLNIDGVRNLSYETKVAKNSSGELKIYCEADLVQ